MENQHRKISGYRELSQAEIDLMNEIKALGPQVEAVMLKVKAHIKAQRTRLDPDGDEAISTQMEKFIQEEKERLDAADPEKWVGWASDTMQTALMYATRAVAQPTFF